MKKIIFTILTIFLVFSCEKENDFEFSGITERDTRGTLIGSVDESDWKFDDVWNEEEEKLFDPTNFRNTYFLTGGSFYPDIPSLDILSSSCTIFPNPVKENLCMRFLSGADTIELSIVNKDYDIVFSEKLAGISIIGGYNGFIDVSDRDKFKANTIYRVYYKLKYIDSKVERGHGDILISN